MNRAIERRLLRTSGGTLASLLRRRKAPFRIALEVVNPGIMTLTLRLPPDLEERLQHEAERQGLPAETLTLRLLDQHLPSEDLRKEVVELLQSWIEDGDAQEQKETGEYLIEALDQDRLSERRLFPQELKGITW